MQLREQTKQLEKDMVELRDQNLVLVSDPHQTLMSCLNGAEGYLSFRNERFWQKWNCIFVCLSAKGSVWGAQAGLGITVFGDSVERESGSAKTNLRETAPLSGAPGTHMDIFLSQLRANRPLHIYHWYSWCGGTLILVLVLVALVQTWPATWYNLIFPLWSLVISCFPTISVSYRQVNPAKMH